MSDRAASPPDRLKTYSLKIQLRRRLVLLMFFALALVLIVDTYAILHIRSHYSSDMSQPSPSLGHELLHTLPVLLVPHMVILIIVFMYVVRAIERDLLLPLLSLGGKLMRLDMDWESEMYPSHPIPEEIAPIFDAAIRHAENLNRSKEDPSSKRAVP